MIYKYCYFQFKEYIVLRAIGGEVVDFIFNLFTEKTDVKGNIFEPIYDSVP